MLYPQKNCEVLPLHFQRIQLRSQLCCFFQIMMDLFAVRFGDLSAFTQLSHHTRIAQKRRLFGDFPEFVRIFCAKIAFQERMEKLHCRFIRKAHEFFDNCRVILAQNDIEIIQIADLRDGVSRGKPVHVDQQRLAILQEYIIRMEITVNQMVGRRQRVDQV